MADARTIESLELATSIVRGTNYAKELRKWNLPKSQGGYNTDGGERYPMMLYKAKKENGKNQAAMAEPPREMFPNDELWRRATEMAFQFNQRAQRIVKDEQEYEVARRDGWRDSIHDAVAFLNGLDDDVAKAAAHRAYEDRNMSDAAKREIREAEAAAEMNHVAEVPEKKRRGRPRKSAA